MGFSDTELPVSFLHPSMPMQPSFEDDDDELDTAMVSGQSNSNSGSSDHHQQRRPQPMASFNSLPHAAVQPLSRNDKGQLQAHSAQGPAEHSNPAMPTIVRPEVQGMQMISTLNGVPIMVANGVGVDAATLQNMLSQMYGATPVNQAPSHAAHPPKSARGAPPTDMGLPAATSRAPAPVPLHQLPPAMGPAPTLSLAGSAPLNPLHPGSADAAGREEGAVNTEATLQQIRTFYAGQLAALKVRGNSNPPTRVPRQVAMPIACCLVPLFLPIGCRGCAEFAWAAWRCRRQASRSPTRTATLL
jgi:hypothetical protein